MEEATRTATMGRLNHGPPIEAPGGPLSYLPLPKEEANE